jgi:transposase-like protein
MEVEPVESVTAVAAACARQSTGAAVRLIEHGARETARAFKEAVLQALIDEVMVVAVGPRRGERPAAPTPFACGGCGPRRGDQLRRNGHYRRHPLVAEGQVALRIPQLVCGECGKAVPFRHALLPPRRRLWLDLDQRLTELYLEGVGYRGVQRIVQRAANVDVGLMTLWRALQAVAEGAHAAPPRPAASIVGLDEVHHRLRGTGHWLLAARARDRKGAVHWVGAVLSEKREQSAWEDGLDALGLSQRQPRYTLISDGDAAIEGAVAQCLPGARLLRCTWHLLHNAADWLKDRYPGADDTGRREGLMAAVRSIVDAPTLVVRRQSLAALRDVEPWLADRLEPVLERVALPIAPVRTNNLLERGFRELRRRTRPMDGFGSRRGIVNFHRLWMLKENARCNGRDYLPELIP